MDLSQETLRRMLCAVVITCGAGTASMAEDGATVLPVVEVAASAAPEPLQMTEGKKDADKPKKDKPVREGWHRDGFALKNGKSKIEITGYTDIDFRNFDWNVQGDETDEQQNPESDLRRVRMGVQGEFGRWSFELGVDPRDSEEGSRLKDSTIGYAFSKKFNILVGHFKPPFSQDFLTSASKTDFLEDALIRSLEPDRDWGVALSGEAGRFTYAVAGLAGDGDGNDERGDATGVARLSVQLVKGLTVSVNAMHTDVEPDARVGAVEPSPKGARGRALSGFTFWNRPHINGKRQRIGFDTTYSRGPFRFQGEVLQQQEERKGQGSTGQDIPDVRGRGWSTAVSYVLTGEKKGSTVEPAKSVFQGGRGALEIAARIAGLKFDDTGDGSGFAGYGNRARNIAPSGGREMEVGLNYWASNFMKFQVGAMWESYNDPLIAPVPGNTGKYRTLHGRIQVMIP